MILSKVLHGSSAFRETRQTIHRHIVVMHVIHVKFIDPWTKCYKKKVSKPVSSFPLISNQKKKKEKEKRNRNCLIQRIVLYRFYSVTISWQRFANRKMILAIFLSFPFLFFSFLFSNRPLLFRSFLWSKRAQLYERGLHFTENHSVQKGHSVSFDCDNSVILAFWY